MPRYKGDLSPTQSHILSELERGAVLRIGAHGIYWLERDSRQYWQNANAVNALIKKGLIALKPLSSREYVKAS